MQQPHGRDEAPLYRYRFEDAEFDEARLEVRVGGLPVELEQRPLQLLAELLRQPDEVLTKEELFERVWAGRPTVDNVLANAIAKLRRALGPAAGERIVTLPRVGYRLAGPVERVAVGRRLDSSLDLRPGAAVPGRSNFQLESRLGPSRGSEVWLARHAKTREPRVYKFAGDGEKLSALKREATLYRVLAEGLGERPDIGRIFDWNFETPPFFLECEYGGANLGEWAAAGHLQPLGLEERIGLFLQIAGAVAAAHSVGVLHKDLKPANVLVAPRERGWQVRLTDFGSGRLLEPGRLEELGITRLGLTVTQGVGSDSSSGTPLYLAPELIAGQPPTVCSDVYALGLMLYQLVCGDLRRPLAPGWEANIGDELLREDIAAATNGNPAHRLAGVAELAARLGSREARRTQRDEARAAALRAEAAERALERSRARRPLLLAAIAALLLGLGVSLWFYLQAAATARQLERQVRVARAVDDFMAQDLIGAANPSTSGRTGVTVIEAAKAAQPHIDQRFADAPEIRAALHQAMQETLAGLTDYESSIPEGRKAVEAHLAARPVDVLGLSESRIRLAWSLSREGHYDEASALLKDAAPDVAQLMPAHPETQIRHWEAQSQIAIDQLDGKASLELDRKAWALMQTLPDADPVFRERIEFNLAESLRMANEVGQSEAVLRDLVARQTLHWGAGHWKTQFTSAVLGNNLMIQQRYAEAAVLLPPAIASLDAGLGRDSRRALMARSILANIHLQQQQYAQAMPLLAEVYAGFVKLSGENSLAPLSYLSTLGNATLLSGDARAAEPLLRKAFRIAQDQLPADSPMQDGMRYNLAACLLDLRRPTEAAPLLQGIDAGRLAQSSLPPPPAPQAMIDYQAGRVALQRGDPAAALPLLRGAVAQLATKMAPMLENFRKRDGDLVALAEAQLKRGDGKGAR